MIPEQNTGNSQPGELGTSDIPVALIYCVLSCSVLWCAKSWAFKGISVVYRNLGSET